MPFDPDVRDLFAGANFVHLATLLPDGGPRQRRDLGRRPRRRPRRVLHEPDLPQGAQPRRGSSSGDVARRPRQPVQDRDDPRAARAADRGGRGGAAIVDRISHKYTGKPFPFPSGLAFVVEVTHSRLFSLDRQLRGTPRGPRPGTHSPRTTKEVRMVRLIMRVLVGTLFMGHGLPRISRDGSAATASRAPASSSRASGCAGQAPRHGGGCSRDGGRRAAGCWVPDARGVRGAHRDDGDRRQDPVHLEKGPWVSDGGWEYNAVIIAALAAADGDGAGTPVPRPRDRHGAVRAVLGLRGPAAGLGGAAANLTMTEDAPPPAQPVPASVQ